MDGGIAAAICLRHLSDLQRLYGKKKIKFQIETMLRPKKHTECVSGILRKNHQELDISRQIIKAYDDLIDCAEIMHNQNSTLHKQYDQFSLAQKLYFLFNSKHPLIDKQALYQTLVYKILDNPNIEEILDSDVLYAGLIQYERINNTQP